MFRLLRLLQQAQSSRFSATVILFLPELHLHNPFAATSRLVLHDRVSKRLLRLHFRALGVSIISVVLARYLTCHLYRSATTTLFATRSGKSHSMSTGCVDLQPSLWHQSPTDVVSISKLAEGGFNRTFFVALRDGRQVATIEYQRTCGIPVPEIYGYSADSDNVAGTAYILMEFVHGPKLSEVWPSLGDEEVISVVRQLTQIESRMMSQPFPAGGSLYFTEDLSVSASARTRSWRCGMGAGQGST
ncbi:hypothetical protein C0991_004613 [Blastosporella zonata]|nr:hypothetical protein C0991_004613 [Blastosporella zonata]